VDPDCVGSLYWRHLVAGAAGDRRQAGATTSSVRIRRHYRRRPPRPAERDDELGCFVRVSSASPAKINLKLFDSKGFSPFVESRARSSGSITFPCPSNPSRYVSGISCTVDVAPHRLTTQTVTFTFRLRQRGGPYIPCCRSFGPIEIRAPCGFVARNLSSSISLTASATPATCAPNLKTPAEKPASCRATSPIVTKPAGSSETPRGLRPPRHPRQQRSREKSLKQPPFSFATATTLPASKSISTEASICRNASPTGSARSANLQCAARSSWAPRFPP
jgi:hypothetical protein